MDQRKNRNLLLVVVLVILLVLAFVFLSPGKKTPDYIAKEGYFLTKSECQSSSGEKCQAAQIDFVPGSNIPSGSYWVPESTIPNPDR